MRMIVLAATVLLASPTVGTSQQLADLRQGARISVTDGSGKQVQGRLVAVSSDSIQITVADRGSSTFALSNVSSVNVRHVSHIRGLLYGALVGSVTGALFGAVIGATDDSCGFLTCGRGQNAAFAAAFIGAGGLALGSLVGIAVGKEVWQAVSAPGLAAH